MSVRATENVMTDHDYVELRVKYPGHPYVALIDGLDKSSNFNRRFEVGECCYHHRDHLDNGMQEQIYRLPLRDAIYEIAERVNGRRVYRYVAVRGGVPRLFRLTRHLVESVVEGLITLEQAVASAEAAVVPE